MELQGNGLICVGIARERNLPVEFVDSQLSIVHELKSQGLFGGYYGVTSCRVDYNRNEVVRSFLEDPRRAEWLLFLDTDMTFPPDIGRRLARLRQPVVGALYFKRTDTCDPVCFCFGKDHQDEYGRWQVSFESLREEVYDFLRVNGIADSGKWYTIDNPSSESLLEVDGIGTGALLIHRQVLEDLPPPWFEFVGTRGEDLYFCERVRKELGLLIYADLSTICGHVQTIPVGASQFRTAFESRGLRWSAYDNERAVAWLSEFFSISQGQAARELHNYSPAEMAGFWKARAPKSSADVLDFYKDEEVGMMYARELLKWNAGDLFTNLRRELLCQRNGNVLELGSGIGTLAIQLALQNNNVVAVEPNEVLRAFAQYRWQWTKDKLSSGSVYGYLTFVPDLSDVADDERFDFGVATDVFEHIHADELPGVLMRLGELMPERGYLFHHNNWGQQDLFPFHYDHSGSWDTWLRDAGFFPINPPLWSLKIR